MGDRDLLELAGRINQAHRRALGGARLTLTAAIEAGRLLLLAQEKVECGSWIEWVKSHLELSVRTVQKYKRLAIHATELGENAPLAAQMGVDEALEFLADAADIDDEDLTDEERAAAIAEEEEEALNRERTREQREAAEDEARKWVRKMTTLVRLAGYFPAADREPTSEEREVLRASILQLAHWAGLQLAEEAAAA